MSNSTRRDPASGSHDIDPLDDAPGVIRVIDHTARRGALLAAILGIGTLLVIQFAEGTFLVFGQEWTPDGFTPLGLFIMYAAVAYSLLFLAISRGVRARWRGVRILVLAAVAGGYGIGFVASVLAQHSTGALANIGLGTAFVSGLAVYLYGSRSIRAYFAVEREGALHP